MVRKLSFDISFMILGSLRTVLVNVFGVTGGKYRYFRVVLDNVIDVTGYIRQRFWCYGL